MTLVPEMRWCKKCKKMYSWNPDVGMIGCPHCGEIFSITGNDTLLEKIFDKKRKKKN